jgi:hypothetical protein
MPKYRIKDNRTGRTVTVEMDNPPSQGEAEEIFRKAGLREEPGLVDKLMTGQTGFQRGVGQLAEGETLPNIGQLIAGAASVPVTAPMSLVSPTAGKAVRTGIGTLGRAGGEIVRQGLRDISQPERLFAEPFSPEAGRYARENLQSMGEQLAVGAGSEALGEFVLGPAISKGVETIVSPTISAGRKKLKQLSRILGESLDDVPVVGTAKNFFSGIVEKLRNPKLKLKAANELLQLNRNKAVRREAQEKGIDLGEEFIKDVAKIEGIDVYQGVVNYKSKTLVPALTEATQESTEKIKLGDDFIRFVEKKAADFRINKPELGDAYETVVKDWIERNGNEFSAYDAWQNKVNLDQTIRTTTGGLPASIDTTSAEKTAFNDIANEFRKQLNKVKEINKLFREYERFSLYENSLKGAYVPGLPSLRFPAAELTSQIKDPGFLLRELQKTAPTEPVVGASGMIQPGILDILGKTGTQVGGMGVLEILNNGRY